MIPLNYSNREGPILDWNTPETSGAEHGADRAPSRADAAAPGADGLLPGADVAVPEPARRAVAGLALDHVAIAVRSFTDFLPLLERLSGTRATEPERVESQGVEVCFVGDVELIRPLVPQGGVGRFVERRGPGLHHMAYRVADVRGKMAELEAGGWEFTSPEPMKGAGGHWIAFLHPRSTGGVLVELVERNG